MSPPLGLLADVVRFSAVDGPGNRFVVFLQGCSFNCAACHNPHTIPLHSPTACRVTVDELLAQVRVAAPFLSGLTVSGGEATVQTEFVAALFAAVKADTELRRLTTFVDSNGSAPRRSWDLLLPVMDGAMIDLKAIDPDVHRRLTRHGNAAVLDSIRHLAAHRRLYEVRLLLVPGINDAPEVLARTADWLLAVDPDIRVKVIGFRRHGVRASAARWPEPSAELRAGYGATLADAGVRDLVIV